jgi:hypothetical protein
MRAKLNENPVVQAAFIGLLLIVVGFMMYTRVINRPEPAPATCVPPAADTAAAEAAATGAPLEAPPGAADPATGVAAPASAPGTPAIAGGSGFKAGPGLPQKVVDAYDADKVVVLLIVRGPGIDDQIVERASRSLRSRDDVAFFVVKAAAISRYSRITRGVDVDRTPALVVLQPKRLAEGGLPTATVAYGARGAASVNQQVRDALYSGRENLPSHPE